MKIGRTLLRRLCVGLATTAVVASVAFSGAQADRTNTTLDRTILDLNGDGRLEYADGEAVLVREDLAKAQAGREERRAALLSIVGFTDFQLADEESPARGPWADLCGSVPTLSAFRPQETMVPHLINSNIRAANTIAAGPITGRPFDFGIQLGDAADNTQRNETRWFIDLLDGGVLIDPDSGNHDLYEGPQGRDPWPSPNGGRSILELANDPFFAPGLRRADGSRVPWYSVLGNHDAKIQGTVPNLPGWWELVHTIAQGPLAIRTLAPDYLQELCADPSKLADPEFMMQLLSRPGTTSIVTVDPHRATLTRNQWKAEHLPPPEAQALDPGARGSNGLPTGHGFLGPRCTDEGGNPLPRLCYSYDSAGIHFIVLDTNPDEGLEGGNIDTAQLEWFERDLVAHSSRYYDANGAMVGNPSAENRLIVVFSHHTRDSMDESFPINLRTTDFPTLDRIDGDGRAHGMDVSALMLRFPNVVMHAAGHTHENRVWARPGKPAADGTPGTGYWEVNSSSHADWPHQSRTIEIVDNKDGTLSIFGVVFDAAAPAQACRHDGTDDPGCLEWAHDPTDESAIKPGSPRINEEYLAAVGREVGYNDPQGGVTLDPDARGRDHSLEAGPSQDRNVELLLANPAYAAASSVKFTRVVAGTRLDAPPGRSNPGSIPDVGSPGGPTRSTSSSFSHTIPGAGDAGSRRTEAPASKSGLPDWAIASAAMMFATSAALFWLVRARVRDSMLGVPVRRPAGR